MMLDPTGLACLDAFMDASLIVNGIYDMICAIAILYFPSSSWGRLHLNSFLPGAWLGVPMFNRIFACVS
jgi:hypothetical protein